MVLGTPIQRVARRLNRVPRRSGAVAVELALCLPILLTVGLGMLETCNIVQVRTRMIVAAYESARLATRPTTSAKLRAAASDVTARCKSLLTQFGVNGATVTLSPADLSNLTPESTVTVTVTAPLSQNCVTAYVIKSNRQLTAKTTLVLE